MPKCRARSRPSLNAHPRARRLFVISRGLLKPPNQQPLLSPMMPPTPPLLGLLGTDPSVFSFAQPFGGGVHLVRIYLFWVCLDNSTLAKNLAAFCMQILCRFTPGLTRLKAHAFRCFHRSHQACGNTYLQGIFKVWVSYVSLLARIQIIIGVEKVARFDTRTKRFSQKLFANEHSLRTCSRVSFWALHSPHISGYSYLDSQGGPQ